MSSIPGSTSVVPAAGPRFARLLATIAIATAIYVGLAQGAYALTLLHGTLSTIWLPSGLSLALLFLGGRSLWPAILIGEFLADLTHGSGAGASLTFAVGDVLEALAARELLVRLDFDPRMKRVRDACVLLVPVALIPTVIGATIGTLGMLTGDGLPWSQAWSTWHTWWLGDATGIIIMAPLVFAWSGEPLRLPRGVRAGEIALFGVALAPLAWLAAGYITGIGILVMPILIWAAMRLGLRGVTVANVVVAAARIWQVGHMVDPGGGTLIHRLLGAQTFLEVAAITTLIVAAVMSERIDAEEALRISSDAASALARERDELSQIATLVARDAARSEVFDTTLEKLQALLGLGHAAIVSNDGEGFTSILVGDDAKGAFAAEITVHGALWGWLRVGPAPQLDDGARVTVGRFASLLGLAITSADQRQRLLQMASTDALTGLVNHRTFHTRLAEELSRCRRYDRPLALAVLDIDHFKTVNDSFGHLVGDQTLITITKRIDDVLRPGAMLGRLGGDEFGVILPECDADAALQAMERVRVAIAAEAMAPVSGVTLSVGICDVEHAGSPERLFELADAALYKAKAAGRDACIAYQPDEA